MPSPIARRPGGFLDLLLTQQSGKNPAELNETVQPVIDMRPFYAQERLTMTKITNLTTTAGLEQGVVRVPPGEAWLVHAIAVQVDCQVANQIIAGHVEVSGLSPTPFTVLRFDQEQAAVNLQTLAQVEWLPEPVVFPSGSVFQVYWGRLALQGQPNISNDLQIIYTRMET